MTLLGLTVLSLGIVGSIVAFRDKPGKAIAVYVALLLLMPEWTIRPMRTIAPFDLTIGKIIVFALIAAFIVKDRRLTGFRLNIIDCTLLVAVIGEAVACLVHFSISKNFEIQANVMSRTALAYFAVRLGVTSRHDLLLLVKTCAVVAVVLSFIGILETVGDFNVYDKYAWFAGGHPYGFSSAENPPQRYGFYRAIGPCLSPHAFGLILCGILPLLLYLRSDPAWTRKRVAALYVVLSLGIMSTMTSAPLYGAAATTAILLMYPLKRVFLSLVAAGVIVLAFWAIFFPFVEGMPSPLEVVFRGAYSRDTAQYRVGLVQEAFGGGMHDHWVFGYGNAGLRTVGEPNPEFTWEHEDLVNVYVNKLARFGLVAALPFALLNLLVFVRLGRAFQLHRYESDARLVWILMALFVGWQVALLSMTVLAQMITFYYIILGVISSLPNIVAEEDELWEAERSEAEAMA